MKHRFLIAAAALTLGGAATAQAQAPAAAQPPAASVTPPTVYYRGDLGHSGYTSDSTPLPLSLLWRHTTALARGNAASPTAANGMIYFGSGANLYAISAADGTQKWQFPSAGAASAAFGTTPMLANGFLYVGGDDAQVYKIDAATGAQVWSKKVGGPVRSSPVVVGNVVYFGSADSHLYALNTDNGDQVWAYQAEGSITTAPIVNDGQVLFACTDNKIYCISAATGRLSWTQRLQSDPSVSPPTVVEGTIYAGAGDTLYALSAHGGSLRWSARLPSQISGAPTVGNGIVYVATEDRKVYALSVDHGKKRWSASLNYPSIGPSLLAGSTLLVPGQQGVLYAFDAGAGTLKWQYAVQATGTATQPKFLSTDVNAAPLWADKTLYVLSDDGTLSAFRADAVDAVPPTTDDLSPTPGSTGPGIRIPYYATLVDVGSGINPATVALSIDHAPISLAKYDPSRNAVYVDLSADTHGDANRSLTDGPHQVLLTAQDWRGNTVTRTWGFNVDIRQNPPGTAINITAPPVIEGDPGNNTLPEPLDDPASPSGGSSNRGRNSVANRGSGPEGGPPPPPPLEPVATLPTGPTTGPTQPTPPPTTNPTPPPPTTTPTQPTPLPPTAPTPPTAPGAPAPPAAPV